MEYVGNLGFISYPVTFKPLKYIKDSNFITITILLLITVIVLGPGHILCPGPSLPDIGLHLNIHCVKIQYIYWCNLKTNLIWIEEGGALGRGGVK